MEHFPGAGAGAGAGEEEGEGEGEGGEGEAGGERGRGGGGRSQGRSDGVYVRGGRQHSRRQRRETQWERTTGMERDRDQGFQTAQARQITTDMLSHTTRQKERRKQLGDDQIALRESTARVSRAAVRSTPRLATERVRAMLRSRSRS